MSKRMVTYQVGDDKIVSIDGHNVGSGGVGDKSISRRMITYKTDDAGKITSIDGHELNGGGGDYEIKELVVTENGVYDGNGEAYKPVRVNVPQTAQSGTLKALLDATQSASYLFDGYTGTSVDGLITPSDTSNVTNMGGMFYECNELQNIESLDMSSVTETTADGWADMFYNCYKLSSIRLVGSLNVSLNISYTALLDYDSVKSILTAASNTTNTDSKELTFSSTLTDQNGELAGLVATCTTKGWTVSGLTLN